MNSWLRLLWESRFQVLPTFLSTVLGGVALLLCSQFVLYELTYDHWNPRLQQLARIEMTIEPPGGEPIRTVGSARGLAPWVRSLRHRAIQGVTAFSQRQITASVEGRKVSEQASFVDHEFFSTMPLNWLTAPVKRLGPNEMALSRSVSARLFGSSSPLGKSITVENEGSVQFTVVGVFEIPDHTHLNLEWLLPRDPLESVPTRSKEDWLAVGDYTYVMARSPSDFPEISALIASTLDRQIDLISAQGTILQPSRIWSFVVRPVQDIHLRARGQGSMRPGGDVRVLQLIGLLTACIALVVGGNLINQAWLLNSRRSRELAVRRLMGETRHGQFMRIAGEYAWITFAALLLAWVTAVAVGSALANQLSVSAIWSLIGFIELAGWGLAIIVAMSLVCGAASAAGTYRATTASLLQRGAGGSFVNVRMRTFLLCLQLGLGSVLASGCLVAWQQLARLQKIPASMSVAGGMVLLDARFQPNFGERLSTLRTEIERVPGVRAVAFVSDVPGRPLTQAKSVERADMAGEMSRMSAYLAVSPEGADALHIKMVAGRFLRSGEDVLQRQGSETNLDGAGVVVNALLAAQLGFASPADAIGRRLRLQEPSAAVVIVGVSEDIRYSGLQVPPQPMLMATEEDSLGHMLVMMDSNAPTTAGTDVGTTLARVFPESGEGLDSLEAIWNQQFSRVQTLALLSTLLAATAFVLIASGIMSFVSVVVRANAKLSVLMQLHGASPWRRTIEVLGPALAAGTFAALLGAALVLFGLSDWSRQFIDRINVLPPVAAATVVVWALAVLWAMGSHRIQEQRLSIADQLRTS